jgi:hypothetical protein
MKQSLISFWIVLGMRNEATPDFVPSSIQSSVCNPSSHSPIINKYIYKFDNFFELVDFTLGNKKNSRFTLELGIPFVSLVTFPTEWTFSPISPPLSTQQPSLNQWWRGGPLGGLARPSKLSGPGEARSQFKGNKYNLKKLGAFTMTKGHGFPHQCLSR